MLRVIVHVPKKNDQTFRFTNWRTVIGRSRSCDLTLVSSQVSKSHAAIEIIEGVISIRDLGSRNGIWINGTQVVRQQELFAGDSIILGDVKLTIDETSKIFENTPNRQIASLVFEEKILHESIERSGLFRKEDFEIVGKPTLCVDGRYPILRVLRITEDYIPRTAYRLSPFRLEIPSGEEFWIRPSLELGVVELDYFHRLDSYRYEEVEDRKNPTAGSAVLLRSYYRLPSEVRISSFQEVPRSSDGLRVFSERSLYEPIVLNAIEF